MIESQNAIVAEDAEAVEVLNLLQTLSEAQDELFDIMKVTQSNGSSYGKQKLCELALKLGMFSYE